MHWESQNFSDSDAWKKMCQWRTRYKEYDAVLDKEDAFLTQLKKEWDTKHPQLQLSLLSKACGRYSFVWSGYITLHLKK
jgi:hypothetical protein